MKSIDDVHKTILETAAKYANSDPRVMNTPFSGHPFFEANNRSQKGGLCLAYEPGLLMLVPVNDRDRVANEMQLIGKDAIVKAIETHKEDFVGLIVGLARENQNYFDLFS